MLTPQMLLRKRSVAATALVLSLILSGSGKAGAWQRVQPPAAGFSVLLPGTPEIDTAPVHTQFGRVTVHSYTVSAGAQAYIITYVDSPAPLNAERALNGARSGAIGDGRLVSEAHITRDGARGRCFVVARGGVQYVAQVYVDGSRLYQTVYVSTYQGPLSAAARSFFDSFRLVR